MTTDHQRLNTLRRERRKRLSSQATARWYQTRTYSWRHRILWAINTHWRWERQRTTWKSSPIDWVNQS
jgi:hypothetical protein